MNKNIMRGEIVMALGITDNSIGFLYAHLTNSLSVDVHSICYFVDRILRRECFFPLLSQNKILKNSTKW